MVKIITLLILALTACTSAIPTVLADISEANTELVPPCMCGSTTGLFCGDRASTKDKNKVISGNCNGTSLYYCSPWACKTGGIADAVQTPCWTGKCHQLQYNRTGIDSCTSTKAEREELLPEADKVTPELPIQCTCGTSPGHFCGERAGGKYESPISGNCNATSLYYCSPWAAKTHGLADAVQMPCWTDKCYQYNKYNNTGIDSCTPVKLKREELASKIIEATSPPPAPCTCGPSTGHFCGERSSGTGEHKPMIGDCNATSLYYCSPWAAKTNGLADAVQSPCWTNICHQSTQLGYDSCTTSRVDVVVRDEVVPEVTAEALPDCICSGVEGYFCGDKAATSAKPGSDVLKGKCSPQSLYYCSAWNTSNNGKAQVVERKCSTGECFWSSKTGTDYCGPSKGKPLAIPRDELVVPKATPAAFTECICNRRTVYFCGNRATPVAKNEWKRLKGDCNPDSVCFCSDFAAKTSGIADTHQSKCAPGRCYQSTLTGSDYCSTGQASISVPERSIPREICTCAGLAGAFCADRALLSKDLKGACSGNDLYYCDEAFGKACLGTMSCTGQCWHDNNYAGSDYCSSKPRVPATEKFDEFASEPTFALVATKPHDHVIRREELVTAEDTL